MDKYFDPTIYKFGTAKLVNKHGRIRDKIESDKHIYGGYLFNKGHKVLFDKGGYIEITEMK